MAMLQRSLCQCQLNLLQASQLHHKNLSLRCVGHNLNIILHVEVKNTIKSMKLRKSIESCEPKWKEFNSKCCHCTNPIWTATTANQNITSGDMETG